tara:strand:- start:7003 stop:7305 length:303 start_codon:yes stop_codon:yes gene_type:complete
MSNKSPLRQLTDIEYTCITGIHQIKNIIFDSDKDLSTKQVAAKTAIAVNALEQKISLALSQKFGLTNEQVRESNFDITIKSGHFIELVEHDEKTDNTSRQ